LRRQPLFKFLLALLKIRKPLGQRLILIAKLFGLSLDWRTVRFVRVTIGCRGDLNSRPGDQ
jgi:hypothetical protein